MLFYGHWGSGATFHQGMLTILQQASRTRLFVGGLVGPVAACLCLIGCWHVRQNLIGHSLFLAALYFSLSLRPWSSAARFTPCGFLAASRSSIRTLWEVLHRN